MKTDDLLKLSEAAITSAYRIGVDVSTIVKMVDDNEIPADVGMELVAEIMHAPNSLKSTALCRDALGRLMTTIALIPARKRFHEKNQNPAP